jgi:hypothetical protein
MKNLTLAALTLISSACFSQDTGMKMDMCRYGGPVYNGSPALKVTASFVSAGGGPGDFSIANALTAMVGEKVVQAEVGKLNNQYGKEKVDSWIEVFNFAVKDSLKIATAAGVSLPEADLKGKKLATTMVKAGLDKDGTFWIGFLLDKAVTHKIHVQVMDDIDAKFGEEADANYHRITNQAMYDAAQALGASSVKLASFH